MNNALTGQSQITEIRNVFVPDFFDFSVAENMTVKINDGIIESVAPAEEDVPKRSLETDRDDPGVIDGGGMVLIPGMTNMHAHTAMTLLRGSAEDCKPVDWFNKHIWIYEQGLIPDDIYVGTLLGGAEMLLNGVTAVADHYFAMDRAWRAYDELGMRADLSWALFGMGDAVEQNLQAALDFNAEYMSKSSRIGISMGPHSPYLCPDDFLKRIAGIAGRDGLKMHIHVAEDARQVEISMKEYGKTPIEVLRDTGVLSLRGEAAAPTILAHAFYATDSDFKIMAESDCIAAHCPKTYLRGGDSHDFLPRGLAAGAGLGLGSDGPASNSTMNIAEAARLAALMGKSSSGNGEKAALAQVLPLMFSGGKVLGLPNYGSVVPGAPADLVILDLSTPEMFPGTNIFADILYGLDGRNVHSVVVDGRLVVRDSKLLTVDYRALRDEARTIASRLISTEADAPMQEY
ncbi:MAG: amidohydrolase family protein [Spirochaetales bacterium]|uniref:Amidohydrolase family protein n=1 Tax=Candidatus Thalassospirochaeta sargassi TaxID=3119039 RepID=A0AAJ1IJQ0_9SPIO|nr:amidohydrolase family protein [Spirochaetales bacterium]